MYSLIIIVLLTVHWPYASTISGGFSAYKHSAAPGIVLIDNGWHIVDPPFCAGALISSQIVLTNGLCCSEPPFNRSRIYLGTLTPFSDGQFFLMDDFRLIGSGSSDNFKLCVIRLDREVKFTKDVLPLPIPSEADILSLNIQPHNFWGYGSPHLQQPGGELNPIYQRVLSRELLGISLIKLDMSTCVKHYGKANAGKYELLCMGCMDNKNRRLMLDDNGAPLVGQDSRMVYGIAATYPKLINGYDWSSYPVPGYVIDVRSARQDILRAMRQMLE